MWTVSNSIKLDGKPCVVCIPWERLSRAVAPASAVCSGLWYCSRNFLLPHYRIYLSSPQPWGPVKRRVCGSCRGVCTLRDSLLLEISRGTNGSSISPGHSPSRSTLSTMQVRSRNSISLVVVQKQNCRNSRSFFIQKEHLYGWKFISTDKMGGCISAVLRMDTYFWLS